MVNSVLQRAVVRARGKHNKDDWKDLQYVSLMLFNHIVTDLRDGCMDCSWIDVVRKYSSVIKIPPAMRKDFRRDIADSKKRLIHWHFEEDKHKMIHRQPTKIKSFAQLGKKECLLKDVVFEIVVKMYELSVEHEQTKDLDEEGMKLFRELQDLKFEGKTFRAEQRRKTTKFEADYRRRFDSIEAQLEATRERTSREEERARSNT